MNPKVLAATALSSVFWLVAPLKAENSQSLKQLLVTNSLNEVKLMGTRLVQANLQENRMPPKITNLRFQAPNIRPFDNRESGKPRCPSCPEELELKPLLPKTRIGLTVSDSPTFFVYITRTSLRKAEFWLSDPEKNYQTVYKTNVSLPEMTGIVSFSLPEQADSPKLEVGKKYHWELMVICDPNDPERSMAAEGEIQRVNLSPAVVSQLEKAAPQDRAAIYAEAGIWFDTLTTLAELRRSYPQDPGLATVWKDLLKSVVDLDVDSQQPIIPLQGN